ncbi:MAG: hypothetical protein KA004_05360 [Verrucomicrobiales bacterium]|nr:hypothetical protein [Verrucomicrobiales bacterium]
MKPPATLGVFLRLAVVLSVLWGFLATNSPAVPVPLPDWVRPIESSLPKVTPEVISEVDDIYLSILRNTEYYELPDRTAKIRSNVTRLVVLREQADLAMIWQYLKFTMGEGPKFPGILDVLKKDRDVAARLLPIIRFRMELFQQAIREQKLKEFFLSQKGDVGGEIGQMRSYLIHQGERADIENLYRICEEFYKIGYNFYPYSERLPDHLKEMEEVRKLGEQADEPYWLSEAQHWISFGVLTAEVLKTAPSLPNTGEGNRRPQPLGPRQPLSQGPKPLPDENQEPWTTRNWPIWILIGLAAAGLLWLLVKRKPLMHRHR